jgi:hypothetical protein
MLGAIAASKKKNDKVDARTIADLLRCNLLPDCYMAAVVRKNSVRSLNHAPLTSCDMRSYILYLNEIVRENEVLNDKTLPKIRMPNRDGFVADPRVQMSKKVSHEESES